MKDKSDVLVAFMAGAALGAFFGVLFAPTQRDQNKEDYQGTGAKRRFTISGDH